jgi:hypothetical protein
MCSRALGEAQQVVGLFTVSLGLEVAVAEAADRHDDRYGLACDAHEEGPLPAIYTGDGLLLVEFPTLAVVESSDAQDAFVGVLSVRFLDALNLDQICHWFLFSSGELTIPEG